MKKDNLESKVDKFPKEVFTDRHIYKIVIEKDKETEKKRKIGLIVDALSEIFQD